jgi:hypothetical protein
MKKYLKFLLPLLVVFLLSFGLFRLKRNSNIAGIQDDKIVHELTATLTINNGNEIKSFNISQYIGKTALEATQNMVGKNIEINGEGENAFITSVEGRAADPKKHEFWELLVNGEPSQVGAGSYVIQNNDQITWKINTY